LYTLGYEKRAWYTPVGRGEPGIHPWVEGGIPYVLPGYLWWVYTPLGTCPVYTPGYTSLCYMTLLGAYTVSVLHVVLTGGSPGLKAGESPGWEPPNVLKSSKV